MTYVELIFSGPQAGGGGSKVKAFKILRLLRLTKMLRVARMKRIFQRYEEQFAAGAMHRVLDALRMIMYVMILAYITHILGCLWYAVGFMENVDADGTITYGWIERADLIRIDRSGPTADLCVFTLNLTI